MAAAVVAVLSQLWYWKRTALTGWARIVVAVCRLAVIAGTCWLLANPMTPWHGEQQPAHSVLLLDASQSMDLAGADGSTRAAQANAMRDAVQADAQLRDRVQVMWFGESVHAGSEPDKNDASRKATRLGAALREIFASGTAASRLNAVVVVSDGAAQDAAAASAMAKVAAARKVPLAVMPVGVSSPVLNAGILACMVERRAAPGTRLPVTLTVQRTNCQDQPVQITLTDRKSGKVVDTVELSTRPGGAEMETAELHVTTGAEPLQMVAKLSAVPGEATLADNETSFTVESTEPKIRVLYMEGTEKTNFIGRNEVTMLPDGVKQEDSRIEVDALTLNVTNSSGGSVLVRATWSDPSEITKDRRGYPRTKEELFRYDLVICSDIPQIAFTKEQIEWTVELVAERGGGFVMVGGYTSFGTGEWDRTPWEKLIPVDMTYAGRGYFEGSLQPFWTEEGKRHPILANLPRKGETLEEILAAHPLFFGTNFINRAKPAAVTLMRLNNDSGQPIVTVQPYGKGRTMAFSSDITQGWGRYHDTQWGPRRGQIGTRQLVDGDVDIGGLVREDLQGRDPAAAKGLYPQPESNAYYRRFWASAIHWLTEKSVAQNASRFFAGCQALTWADDAALSVYAIAADPDLAGKVASWRTVAWVKDQPSARTVLAWQSAGSRFTGAIPRPTGLPEGENAIVVETVSPDQKEKYRSEFSVRVMPYDPEFSHPQPRPELLKELAAATGAPVFDHSAAVTAWLRNLQSVADEKAVAASVPAWDRWPLIAALLVLLGLEWIVRRLYT